jgi:O-antigen/teichoic acid export membrane protein
VASLSLALFAVQGLEFGLAQTDKIVLGVYLHAREVGIYSIAAALVAFVSLALQSVNQIFSPTIAELHARGEMELLARLFRSLVKWTLGLTVPLAIVMILYARSIMGMFGWDFVSGWPVLAVGTIGQLVNCGVGSVGYLLLMSGHQQKWLRIQSVMAVALVILNLLLIPRVGMLGAAIAVATITSASNLLCLREVRRSLGIRPSLKKYYALMAPSVATLACVLTIRRLVNTPWPAWWMIGATLIVSYAVFIGSSLWFLDEDDRDIAKAVQSKLRAMVGGPTGTDR